MTVSQLFEHLAYELKAQHVRMLAMAGLYAQGVGPIVPPGEAFELFQPPQSPLRDRGLSRRGAAARFAKSKASRRRPRCKSCSTKASTAIPNPNIDEPGFHKPHKLAFKYLKVSFAPFLDEAKKQITDAANRRGLSEGHQPGPAQSAGAAAASSAARRNKRTARQKRQPESDKPAERRKTATSPPPKRPMPSQRQSLRRQASQLKRAAAKPSR